MSATTEPRSEHEAHWGDHNEYACRLTGPHCWACNEPWPCRASRGIEAEVRPFHVDLDTLDTWQENITRIELDITEHFDREHTKAEHIAMLREVSSRLSTISADLWSAGHTWTGSRWEPPTRYMRKLALARLTAEGEQK